MKKVSLIVQNEEGLHARPVTIFVNAASSFKSNITVIKNSNPDKVYVGKSIISLMSMAASKGDEITIIADGEDEETAVINLKSVVEGGFSS
ncbi:phosphotransferase system HPr (HPr) family protein [Acetoanaerobium pronyense]|uniref:Phosphotransferase system HPr (HPr) family protein n=1 Tax=Acetoanaerobium pronyense TaxID=1482736 RepID=A0ABS4KLZ0_9FIRM|nr:HPr family phosphocarrier protein [Acetoanaerobium pronyense]MBP2028793.1 phosphotransferase system HPr (HPr) family protein [Acetoanaerobium pronyense]